MGGRLRAQSSYFSWTRVCGGEWGFQTPDQKKSGRIYLARAGGPRSIPKKQLDAQGGKRHSLTLVDEPTGQSETGSEKTLEVGNVHVCCCVCAVRTVKVEWGGNGRTWWMRVYKQEYSMSVANDFGDC